MPEKTFGGLYTGDPRVNSLLQILAQLRDFPPGTIGHRGSQVFQGAMASPEQRGILGEASQGLPQEPASPAHRIYAPSGEPSLSTAAELLWTIAMNMFQTAPRSPFPAMDFSQQARLLEDVLGTKRLGEERFELPVQQRRGFEEMPRELRLLVESLFSGVIPPKLLQDPLR